MKLTIVCAVCFVVGCLTGIWLYGRFVPDFTVKTMTEANESTERVEALRDLRAIEWINGGGTNDVARLLSSPVAKYYVMYHDLRGDW